MLIDQGGSCWQEYVNTTCESPNIWQLSAQNIDYFSEMEDVGQAAQTINGQRIHLSGQRSSDKKQDFFQLVVYISYIPFSFSEALLPDREINNDSGELPNLANFSKQ